MERHGLTISNRITVLRILAIPVFALTVVYYIHSAIHGHPNAYLWWASIVLFVLAASSDALDGYLARARNERTRLGAVLDPLADKGLLLCALVLLSGPWGRVFDLRIPPWYVLMVISRDAILIVGSVVIHLVVGHVEVLARFSGKASTVFQMAIILSVLLHGSHAVTVGLLVGATFFTLLSTGQYVLDGVRQLEKAHGHDDSQPPK